MFLLMILSTSFAFLTEPRAAGDSYRSPQFQITVLTSDGAPVEHLVFTVKHFVDTFDQSRAPVRDSMLGCIVGTTRPRLEKRSFKTNVFRSDLSGSIVVPEINEPLTPDLILRPGDDIEVSLDTANLGLQVPFSASDGQTVFCGMSVTPRERPANAVRDKIHALTSTSALKAEYQFSLPATAAEMDQHRSARMEVCRHNAEVLIRARPGEPLGLIESRYRLSDESPATQSRGVKY